MDNTLTGFLVDLIRHRGQPMTLSEILPIATNRFPSLRKPSGKSYNPKSVKKSLMCALTANGVFKRFK